MVDGVLSICFYALIGAFLSLVAVASSTRAKTNMMRAFSIQLVVVAVFGILSSVPAGLTAEASYPHYLVPGIFFVALVLAHVLWRVSCRQRNE